MKDKQLEEYIILKQQKLGNGIAMGFKKFLTVFATLGLSTVIAISATSCISTGENNPPVSGIPGQTQPLPEDPGKQDPPIVDPDPDGPGKEEPPVVDPDDPGTDPDDPGKQDPPVEDKFELNAETVSSITKNVKPIINYYCRKKLGNDSVLKEIKDIYLEKSEGSAYVDTIGTVFIATVSSGSECLEYGTITLPVQSDLTYESLSKTAPTITQNDNPILERIYTFNQAPQNPVTYATAIGIIGPAIFENYNSAEYMAYRFNNGASDGHRLVLVDELSIRGIYLRVEKDYLQQPAVEALEKYFIGKQPSASTFTLVEEASYTLPANTINLKNYEYTTAVEQDQ